jgi:cysteine-rich repeat protein
MRKFVGIFSLSLCLAPGAVSGGVLDLNGKWGFNGEIVVMTHTGNSLSFVTNGIPFAGTVTPGSPFSTYVVSASPSFPAQISGRIMPSENLLDARVVSGMPPDLFASGTFGRRCGCDDGNSVSGDGCDAECQVEPCFSCTGDPSVCVPLPEDATCEDGSACTTGETCTAGVCGGGSVVSPCTDMSGSWFHQQEIPSLDLSFSDAITFEQTGTDVVGGGYVGTIDPTTGAFDLRASSPIVFLFCAAPFDTLVGSVAADGQTWVAEGSYQDYDPFTPEFCLGHPLSGMGSRCGNGEVGGGEECDDANLDDGDGCGADCLQEACWNCQGQPSVCASAPQSPCSISSAPQRSLLSIKDRDDAARDRITWRWKKGAEVPLASLGDPIGGDSYELCIFDESGPESLLAFAAAIPGGGMCGNAPCWREKGKAGFRYARADGAPDGAVAVRLRAAETGRSAVVFKGRGTHLTDRVGGLPALPLATPLRVQLRGGFDLCVESEHTAASVIANDAVKGRFKARGAPPGMP